MKRDPKLVVSAGYDQVTAEYARLEKAESWPRLRWLRAVLERLPEGTAVLDLGCGSGDPAGIEIAKRHRLTGVDVSAVHIELARARLPQADLICASALDVEFPSSSFDAVVTFYTLDHIPRDRHQDVFARIREWLRPDGLLLLSVEDCDQPDAIGKWLGVDMFFSQFDAATTERLVRDAGFSIESSAVETQDEGGTAIRYLWLLATKPQR